MSVTETTNIGTRVSVNTNTTQVRITPADQSKLVISNTTQNRVVISDPSRHDSIESVAPVINTVQIQDISRQSVITDTNINTVVVNTGIQGPKGDTGDTGPQASDTNLANSQLVLSENRSFILNSSALSFREDALTTHNQSLQIDSDGITVGAEAGGTAFLRLRNANDGNSLPNALSFRTPSTLGTNVTWTLPSTILTDGLLTTNGSGEWSFTDTLNINELTASGNISSSINSTASFGVYLGDGSQLTGVQSTIETGSFAVTGSNVTFNHITASGGISASGDISANNLYVSQYIKHNGDPNTYLDFTDDRLRFNIGGISYLDLNDASTAPHDIIFNNGNNNVDLTIKGSSDTIFFTDASTNRVGIGTGTPTKKLTVEGDISASGTLIGQTGSFGYITTEEFIAHKGDVNTAIRFTTNKISLDAGGMTFFAVHDDDSAPFTATVNGGSNRINFKAMDKNNNLLLKTDSDAFNVGLYYAGNKKLETVVGGVDITGNITASGNISASGNLIGDILTCNGITFPQDTNITIQTPDEDESNGAGGNLTLEAGDGNGSNGVGGDLIFNAGKSSGGGDPGDIILNTYGARVGVGVGSGSLIISSKNISADADGDVTVNKILVGAGTSGAPSIAFAGDTSTGLYRPAPNNLSLQVAGGAVELTLNTIGATLNTPIEVLGSITSSAISASGALTGNSLNISSNQVDFTALPTSDPGVVGRLFQTSSLDVGMDAGFQVILISQG